MKNLKILFYRNKGLRVVVAVLLLLSGMIASLLPFVPGIPLLIFGGYLLNPPWFKKKIKELKDRTKKW